MSNARRNRVPRPSDLDHGNLIPPDQLFGRVLGRFIPDADLPFDERVERAWARLLARFEADEHERLREVLVKRINKEDSE